MINISINVAKDLAITESEYAERIKSIGRSKNMEKWYYLSEFPETDGGYTHRTSTAHDWENWLCSVVPDQIDGDVKKRLISNLKHVLVGLEMKAGLIIPHGRKYSKGESKAGVLFEPFFHVLNFEFCIGAFSVCEGLGAAYHSVQKCENDKNKKNVSREEWCNALTRKFGEGLGCELGKNIKKIGSVRDNLHQDRLQAREGIDWHNSGYCNSFLPAYKTIETILKYNSEKVPQKTNLNGISG